MEDPEALAEACRAKDVDRVRELVRAGVDVDHGTSNPPLIWAVVRGHDEIFDLLMKAGADVDVRNKHGATALHHAAFITERVRMAVALLDAGADIDARSPNNFPTALHKAATEGDAELVAILLDRGARTDIPCPTGMTIVEAARKRHRRAIVAMLERHIACELEI